MHMLIMEADGCLPDLALRRLRWKRKTAMAVNPELDNGR